MLMPKIPHLFNTGGKKIKLYTTNLYYSKIFTLYKEKLLDWK